MKTLEIIVGTLMLSIFIGFIIWSTIQIFRHEGPDESSSRVRYDEADQIAENLKNKRA